MSANARGSYRSIHVVVLDEPRYQDLSPTAKLVFLTLKLQLGPSGLDVINAIEHSLAEQTGCLAADVSTALEELLRTGWIRRERSVVEIVGGLDDEPLMAVSNPNHRKAIKRHVDGLPQLPIVVDFKRSRPKWFDDQCNESQTAPLGTASGSHSGGVQEPTAITDNGVGDTKNHSLEFERHKPREGHSPHDDSPRNRTGNSAKPFDRFRGEAFLIAGELRAKRTFLRAPAGGRYTIDEKEIQVLSRPAQKALQAIGGSDVLAATEEGKVPIVFGQFATAYAAAMSRESELML